MSCAEEISVVRSGCISYVVRPPINGYYPAGKVGVSGAFGVLEGKNLVIVGKDCVNRDGADLVRRRPLSLRSRTANNWSDEVPSVIKLRIPVRATEAMNRSLTIG